MTEPQENETQGELQSDSVATPPNRVVHNGKMLVSFSELITLLFMVCGGVLTAAIFLLGQIDDLRDELTNFQTQVANDHSDFMRESDSEHWTRILKSDFDTYVQKNEQRLDRDFSYSDARHWNATERFFAYQDVVCNLHTDAEQQYSCRKNLLAIATCLQEQEKSDRSAVGGFRRFGRLDVESCLNSAE